MSQGEGIGSVSQCSENLGKEPNKWASLVTSPDQSAHPLSRDLMPMRNAPHAVNALVIGSMGVGKSTLCNFLSSSDTFGMSSGIDRCTTKVQAAITSMETNVIQFIDTPGLNEPNFSDEIANVLHLLTSLSRFRYVNAVLFVSNACCRFDQQTRDTFQYYLEIMSDVIHPANFLFVETHCPSEVFDAEFSDAVDEETACTWMVKRKRDVVEKIQSTFHFEVMNYNILNIAPEALRDAPHRFQESGKITIFDYSLRMRSEILRKILACEPIFLRNSHFPLPPHIDSVFQRAMIQLDLERTRLLQASLCDRDVEQYTVCYRQQERHAEKRNKLGKKLIDLMKNESHVVLSVTAVLNHDTSPPRAYLTVKRSDIENYFLRKMLFVPSHYHVKVVICGDAVDIDEILTPQEYQLSLLSRDVVCKYVVIADVTGSIANSNEISAVQEELLGLDSEGEKIVEFETKGMVINPKVDAITLFLNKYGYVSRTEGEDEGRRMYSLSEWEDVLGVFKNPKNRVHLRTSSLRIRVADPYVEPHYAKSDPLEEKKCDPLLMEGSENRDADSNVGLPPHLSSPKDSVNVLFKSMITSAMDKAHHMIRSQRCTAVTPIELTDTFQISTIKCEVATPREANIHLSVTIMNSSQYSQNVGMEQWRLFYLPKMPLDYHMAFPEGHISPKSTFKSFCVLFRSLESLLCFLPSYSLVKHSRRLQCVSSFQCFFQECDPSFMGSECREFDFKKIVTPVGEFCISVRYRATCPHSILLTKDMSDFILKHSYGDLGESRDRR